MTDTPTHEQQTTDVTFRLAPRSDALPYQWVESIATPDDVWHSGQEWYDPDKVESVTVELPVGMAQNLMDFARRHIGPHATDKEVAYWCHTFAHKVGTTALELAESVHGGEQSLADAKARDIFAKGDIVSASELAVGEHAVVGDADPKSTAKAPTHSMVGIGQPKGVADAASLAVQVDARNGNLYVGKPADYLQELRQARVHTRPTTQPELYVVRPKQDDDATMKK